MTRSCASFFSGPIPSRLVCAILAIISLAFVSILRYEHDRDNLKIPMALNIVSMIWFLTGAAMAVYMWYLNVAFCPRRAMVLVLGGLIAAGCCVGTSVIAGLTDSPEGDGPRRLQNAVVSVNASAAILEVISIIFLVLEWNSRSKMDRSMPHGKQSMDMQV